MLHAKEEPEGEVGMRRESLAGLFLGTLCVSLQVSLFLPLTGDYAEFQIAAFLSRLLLSQVLLQSWFQSSFAQK